MELKVLIILSVGVFMTQGLSVKEKMRELKHKFPFLAAMDSGYEEDRPIPEREAEGVDMKHYLTVRIYYRLFYLI